MVDIDWNQVRAVLGIIEAVVVFALGIYMFITRNSAASRKETAQRIQSVREDLKQTNRRVDRHGERISVIEESVRCAPSHDDLGKLHGRIDDVAGSMREIKGTMQGMSHTVQLIHKHLLEERKGGH